MPVFCVLTWLFPTSAVADAVYQLQTLPLRGQIADDARIVRLEWLGAKKLKDSRASVSRRSLGSLDPKDWREIGGDLGAVNKFIDRTTVVGEAYEYKVERYTDHVVDIGYWATGVEVPAIERPGVAIVVVDETISDAIAKHLDRFTLDLVGAGWTVSRIDTPRHLDKEPIANLSLARNLKAQIRQIYNKAPDRLHALILVGHVPVVFSGMVAPDGHNRRSVPTDLFYADMDVDWSDDGKGVLLPSLVPNDGIELQVGRIDLAPVSGGDAAREITLLQAYFDKNHHWRQGLLDDLREGYGKTGYLQGERFALGNIVGPDGVTQGGHHDVGEEHPWLWGIDFGDWKGRDYARKYAMKAVFTINFGSYKHLFSQPENAMTAVLAQPFYPISVGWGARPTWRIHAMALGRTIGDSHLRTVNHQRGADPYRLILSTAPKWPEIWRRPVWVNLLGDPTTHAFPLKPPSGLVADLKAEGMELSWVAPASQDVLGYMVYRADPGSFDFTALTPAPIKETTFTDPEPGGWYMVRAYGLKNVYAGSFYSYSQGAFVRPGDPAFGAAESHEVTTEMGVPVPLTFPDDGVLRAFIEPPENGQLTRGPEGWLFTPSEGFSGEISMTFSRFDGVAAGTGHFTVSVR